MVRRRPLRSGSWITCERGAGLMVASASPLLAGQLGGVACE
nr:MAG TPA: hypothetical protein [Caudoviricetes sp.]DAN77536.1 MAG TPA: hypothetical protein [Bacteriophage sp.]